MQRAGQTTHGARPNRKGVRGFGCGHVPARRVQPSGRSLEPRSDAWPRGMTVPPEQSGGQNSAYRSGCRLIAPLLCHSGLSKMTWFKQLFGSTRRITVNNPLIIQSPRIGFFNLLGSSAQPMLEEDRAALESLFTAATVSSSGVPTCDVLLIYARVETDGRIGGTIDSLRDIIRKANALIAIMASEMSRTALSPPANPLATDGRTSC